MDIKAAGSAVRYGTPPVAQLSFWRETGGAPVGKESPCTARQLGRLGPVLQMGPEPAAAGRHSLERPLKRPRKVPWYISSLSKASAFYFWYLRQPVPHLTTPTWTLGSLVEGGERREWPPSPAGAALSLRERKTRGSKRPGKRRQ